MKPGKVRAFWTVWTVLALVWLVAYITLMASIAHAASAKFSWLPNTEPDLAGYKIHYGSESGTYETVIDVGLPDIVGGRVVYTIEDIPADTTYYAATAYDTGGLESDYSAEVIYNPAPMPPADLQATVVNINININ